MASKIRRRSWASPGRWSPCSAPTTRWRLLAGPWPTGGPPPGGRTGWGGSGTLGGGGGGAERPCPEGPSVVSVFVRGGRLPAELTGWSEVALQGQRVYTADPDDRSVAWSAGGFVYTVIADAPGQTVNQVIAALPHDARPGLAARLTRGLRRLVSCADPFR